MSMYFVSSLYCKEDWIGFIGADSFSDLFWGLNAQGLNPQGVIFRRVDDSAVSLLVPVLPILEELILEGDTSELVASPVLASDSESAGDGVMPPDSVIELYNEAMGLILDGSHNDEWLAFESEDDVVYHYESAYLNGLMSERRQQWVTLTPPPVIHEESDTALSFDHIVRLKAALTWLGHSTPESMEECAAKQKTLVMDLIRSVERLKKEMQEG